MVTVPILIFSVTLIVNPVKPDDQTPVIRTLLPVTDTTTDVHWTPTMGIPGITPTPFPKDYTWELIGVLELRFYM